MIKNYFFVALGGLVGAVLRFSVGESLQLVQAKMMWPLATTLVNLLGCLLIGSLAGLAVGRIGLSPGLKLFLITGILGGFTTFSAFALENFKLFSEQRYALVFANVMVQVVGGFILCGAGFSFCARL